MNLNKVILVGRTTTDVEMKKTTSGDSVCTFNLATNRTWKDNNGQKKEDVQFHKIVLWRKLAEIADQYLDKGALVLIEGRLVTRSYEDKTGAKRYVTEVVGESMQLGPKPQGTSSPETEIREERRSTKKEVAMEDDGDMIDVKDIPF